ncbi:hypothetical protein EG68_03292 [Paragonimus skrjabini miyazakii]|uniref:L-seryl-tRNA(Sec) kinase n=1 Tax=Paragonimus skrjabini miyazakii TaxID=59628 RepID=A0A8S9YUV4_9TREM|nr:hypothetical protein EG68_03292 [Paragonimus skrjabini miyazakii]
MKRVSLSPLFLPFTVYRFLFTSGLSIPPTVRPFEMNKTVIVTLVGLPGSGKSSVCSELVKCNTPNTQMFWIHYDNLIPDSAFIPDTLGFSDDAYTSEWKKYRQRIADCVERLLIERLGLELDSNLSEECLALYLRMPKLPCKSDETRVVLLLDDNFYYSSMRHTYFLLAKRYGLGFLSVACHCPLSVCLSRNSHRSNSVPDHIIIRMERKIEWPDPHVNQWEKHTVTLDCFSLFTPSDLRMILEGINVAMQEPFSYAEEIARLDRSDADREINAHSLIHGLDAVLRSTVGQLMAANGL